ncbi:hypothetical protein B9G79_11895 [Bdellovibrio bacteriovorus]|uniref:Uncharacterized protein n=2 Tax=Bdellovibrio bacteriovorus TaxID=959 RepID=A0A1Z3N9U0_BDEBC|nr:hypothetical protein B9G79_11895 [Bdellovibrio bacteriovorus]
MMEKRIVHYLNTEAKLGAGAGVTGVVMPLVFSSPSSLKCERVFLGCAFILQFTYTSPIKAAPYTGVLLDIKSVDDRNSWQEKCSMGGKTGTMFRYIFV